MNSDNSDADPIAVLANEFLDRYQRGENPTVEQYIEAHPALADRIRQLFPTLIMVEELSPADNSISETTELEVPLECTLDRIGDYRLIRELGRGGMGVVYEAEQSSLGRRVALKVLQGQLSSTAVERFQLEARVAARLRHSNIVPVHEVGQEDGTWFYAMQQIPGLGLDKVLDKLNGLETSTLHQRTEGTEPNAAYAATVAESLTSGHHSSAAAKQSLSSVANRPVRDTTPGHESTVRFPDKSELSDVHHNRSRYFLSVASIGLQVTSALSYAHEEGVLHRDVKPSNLLLDAEGNTWLSDFGLAKVGDGSLTQTGGMVGTLRYMSPERFRGLVDHRSDVYSLGMTLYELLVLRPAFVSEDRAELIRLATTTDPPHPRKLDRRIPRDLETIVVKAISKAPDDRYQSASEMAKDLERFLADRPIQARQASPRERIWRWCRRNPLVACLLVGLMAGCVVSVTMWSRARHQEKLAQLDYRQALQSSNRVFEIFTDDMQLLDPALQPLRRRFFHYSLDNYQTFLARHRDDPTLERQLIYAYRAVGGIKRDIDDFQGSLAAYENALDLLRNWKADRESDAQRAATYSDMALAKFGQRQYEESLQLYRQAKDQLGVYSNSEPLERELRVLRAIHSGVCMIHLRNGLLDKAEEGAREAVRNTEALVALDSSNTYYLDLCGRTYTQFGWVLLTKGNAEQAEKTLKKSLQLFESLPHPTPHHRARISMHIAEMHLNSGQPVLAERWGTRAAEMFKHLSEIDTDYHVYLRGLAAVQQHLGKTCSDLMELSDATSHYRDAIASEKKLLEQTGEASTSRLAAAHLLLGELLVSQKQISEAREHLRKAVKYGAVGVTTQDPVALKNVSSGLAQLARLEKEFEPAKDLFERSISMRSDLAQQCPQVLEYQADLAGTECNLANLYFRNGNAQEAIPIYRKAAETLKRVDSQGIPLRCRIPLPTIHYNLALALHRTGQINEARQAQAEALKNRELLVESYPEVQRLRHDLATTYSALGYQGVEPEKNYRRAIALWEPMVGKHVGLDTSLGGTCFNLAKLLCPVPNPDAENLEVSRELLQKAVGTLDSVVEKHPNYKSASDFLWNALFGSAQSWGNVGSLRSDPALGEREIARSLSQERRNTCRWSDQV